MGDFVFTLLSKKKRYSPINESVYMMLYGRRKNKVYMKKISIIIPVYNVAPYLRECLDQAPDLGFCSGVLKLSPGIYYAHCLVGQIIDTQVLSMGWVRTIIIFIISAIVSLVMLKISF